MLKPFVIHVALAVCFFAGHTPLAAQNAEHKALQAHFERVITARHNTAFEGIQNVEQWQERKARLRLSLQKMLWHDLRLPDTPPPARIVHREERPAYILESVILETAPKLYLTGNLYLPRTGQKPFPVVLYQCGHANKALYMHHGAWFAANGIAALVMDNIEMGEVEFTHHGVYSHAWFHWYSRGFSPLGVEILNARRAVDYLASRSDLDSKRIGATGRSGGGMTTFFLAAIDERIKASAPVSGTLSTSGWVKHRLSSAHCDCQYPVNSHGLLYSEIGALVAPRAQLLTNADADRGFPMDSLHEMADKMREIYRLYKAEDALGIATAPGGHRDTEEIRLPVFSFFLKEFLGADRPLTSEGPVDKLPRETLMCFRDGFPLDERLTRIDEELIPAYEYSLEPLPAASRENRLKELTNLLRTEVFRYFPEKPAAFEASWEGESVVQRRKVKKVSFNGFEDLRVRGLYSLPEKTASGRKLPGVLVVDHRKGIPVWGNEQPLERNQWGQRAVLIVETLDRGSRSLEQNMRSYSDDDLLHHMKRTAMVAGTTLESMQLYEVLRSLEFLRSLPEVDPANITILGTGETGINGLYAAVLDGKVSTIALGSPPASHRQGPTYLNILRYTDIPEVIALMKDKTRLYGEISPVFRGIAAVETLNSIFPAE